MSKSYGNIIPLLENEKNREQMHGILQGKGYELFNAIYCLSKEETI